jgi:hypothetical protein
VSVFDRFLAFMNRGGPINWCIAGLYVLVLLAICKRVLYFSRTRYNREALDNWVTATLGLSIRGGETANRGNRAAQPMRLVSCFLERCDETERGS